MKSSYFNPLSPQAGVDTGQIIAQEAVEVKNEDSEESLSDRIRAKEHHLFPRWEGFPLICELFIKRMSLIKIMT